MLSKPTEDTELGEALDSFKNREALQRSPDKLKDWAITSHMSFNKSKCLIQCLGQCNPGYFCILGDRRLKSSSTEGNLGTPCQWQFDCKSAAWPGSQTAYWTQGYIRYSTESKMRESSAQPPLEHGVGLPAPQHMEINLLESIQKMTMRSEKGLQDKTYEKQLRSFGLLILKETERKTHAPWSCQTQRWDWLACSYFPFLKMRIMFPLF